jgi:MSHA pilin protein MshD
MTAEAHPHRQSRQHGYTLIEIIVSVVVFGILIVLMIAAFVPNVSRGIDPLFSVRAAELGQSYLDEILGKRFAENSPPGNGLRCGEAGGPGACGAIGSEEAGHANFDDVDDYHNLSESPPLDSSGTARPGYNGFRVQVSVSYAGADLGVGANDAKRIAVTVTTPSGGTFLFAAYKANF